MAKAAIPPSLNICIVTKKFPIVGRAADRSYLFQIAKNIASRGHRVTILAASNQAGKKQFEDNNLTAYYLNQGQNISEDDYPNVVKNTFAKLHREKPFHIVHGVDRSALKILKVIRGFNPHVVAAMDVEVTRLSELFSILGMAQETVWSVIRTGISLFYKYLRTFYGGDRKLLRKANGVFVTSPQQRIALERYYLYPDRRIYTVSYGIETTELGIKEDNIELKKELGIQEDTFTIMAFSDMTELNEVRTLLHAFEKVVLKKPNSRLVIIGHGPMRHAIEYEMYNLVLGSKVHLVGAIKNLEITDYVGLADIFIHLSSRSTGFEGSVLEAMAQKKIVIGSEVSALSTLIEDRKDGFLVRPADIESISHLILDIINQQIPTLEIGDNARRKVISYSDPEKMTKATIDAYFDILKMSGLYKVKK